MFSQNQFPPVWNYVSIDIWNCVNRDIFIFKIKDRRPIKWSNILDRTLMPLNMPHPYIFVHILLIIVLANRIYLGLVFWFLLRRLIRYVTFLFMCWVCKLVSDGFPSPNTHRQRPTITQPSEGTFISLKYSTLSIPQGNFSPIRSQKATQ